jgi:thioredoxin-related protein
MPGKTILYPPTFYPKKSFFVPVDYLAQQKTKKSPAIRWGLDK